MLHAKREVASKKKALATGKVVREFMSRPRWVEWIRKATLGWRQRSKRQEKRACRGCDRAAIKKGAGVGEEKLIMEHVSFEGYTPHKVPVIVEVYTDNVNRTAPEIATFSAKAN